MIKIINIGMNHDSAPVALRECLATDPNNSTKAFDVMRNMECIKEAFFLSTCNRVEALVVTEEEEEAKKKVISMMAGMGNLPEEGLLPNLYILQGMDAVRHMFMVASSLDSMVVGEPQILGQIKEAYAGAIRQKASGVILNRLMHRAFHAAKRVRTETGICESAVSISYAAVELAKKIFHALEGKKVLLIGAGQMAELAARHLLSHGVTSIVVANRTFDRALEVAEIFKARPVYFDEIVSQLLEVDIVITSTAAQDFLFTYEQVKACLRKRKNRPLFFIDIAVPRNVQPEINDLNNVYVYDIDELKGIIQINVEQRKLEAVKAERIIQEEVVKFEKWLKTLAVVPTIVSLKEKAESIIAAELKKSNSTLAVLSHEQKQAVEILARSIAEKLLTDPISFLKGRSARPTLNNYLDVVRRLFNLE
ncbi:Glutamyl-tRNA reductase [uncultured Desulfobacterium sp.]|uniref:Glutamyl-tRNA reductase n=1 Tax=uncultured Desulfobacterium sp. TaxID=201089 RepID=A0A445N309_9BACT|nr:Glutamyl-tRNA reductase [uncultured Desulfobacterium sp.]